MAPGIAVGQRAPATGARALPRALTLIRRAVWSERVGGNVRTPYSPPLVAYVASLVVLGGLLSAVTFSSPRDWTAVVLVGIVILVMSRTAVQSIAGVDYVFTASTLLHIGCTVTFGAPGALVCAVAETAGAGMRRRTGVFKSTFNLSNHLLTDLSAWGAYVLVSRHDGRTSLLWTAGLAAGLGAWLVNHVLIVVVLRLASGATAARTFLLNSFGMAPYFAIYGFSALAFLPLFDSLGLLGVLTLIGPLCAAQLFLVVMERHTKAHQEERQRHLAMIEEQNRSLEQQNIRIERAHDATLIALTHALDARDKETEGHSRRVVEYSRIVARQMGLEGDRVKVISHGALLHDIGKIGVPDAILHKPAALTEEEWAIMRMHPQIGHAMVEDVELLRDARRLILHHHERWDGSGYPRGLRGKEIDQGARIFAVADALDAITQDRPYRRGKSLDHAREEILRFRGIHFDPEAVDAFLSLSEGELLSIVRLRSRPGLDLLIDSEARARYLASLGLGIAQLTSAA